MSKHTPGPWYADESFIRSSAKDGLRVAGDPEQGDGSKADWKRWEANAALIAAAPDLLEACQSAQRILKALRSMDEQHTGDKEAMTHVFLTLNDAIAKAEGRA